MIKVTSIEVCRHENEHMSYVKSIETDEIIRCIEKERKEGIADYEIVNYQIGNAKANETWIDMHLVNVDNLTIEELERIITSANRFYEEIKDLMNIRKRPGRM